MAAASVEPLASMVGPLASTIESVNRLLDRCLLDRCASHGPTRPTMQPLSGVSTRDGASALARDSRRGHGD
eukprot:2437965-Prymnesium_polylepis.1